MNKKEFVKAVSSEGGLPLSDAARAVEAMIQVICYAISKGQKVVLSGFGTFLLANTLLVRGIIPVQGVCSESNLAGSRNSDPERV